jgi:hypothetical protein
VGHGEEIGEDIFGVFEWVERRKASQPSGFSDEGRIRNHSAVPMFFWHRRLGLVNLEFKVSERFKDQCDRRRG